MIKRLIAVLILAATLLGIPVCVSAAEPEFYEDQISVCHNGALGSVDVLVDDKGTIYGSDHWIWYFGRYAFNETDTTLEYYYSDQKVLAKYAKRIFIDKTTGEYKVCVYRGGKVLDLFLDGCADYVREYIESKPYSKDLEDFIKKNFKKDYDACVEEFKSLHNGFKVLEEGKFSSLIVHEDDIWMPIEELLPLLSAHVGIFDGALQIKNVTTSIWQALYGFNMEGLEFNAAEELYLENGKTAVGWIMTTLLDLRADRLDLLDHSGDINDYKAIFESYLLDNKVYLECFGGEDDIVTQKDNEWTETLKEMGELSEAYDFFKGAIDFDMEVLQVAEFLPTGVTEAIQESVQGSAGLEITGELLKYSKIIGSYVYNYVNQVKDHRQMLVDMYEHCFVQGAENYSEGTERRWCPSYKAAIDVSETYSGEVSELLDAIIEDIKDEFDTKFIEDVVLGKMKPAIVIYKTAVGIMKLFDPEDYKNFLNDSYLKKIDKICATAVDCYDYASSTLERFDYSSGALNRLRLMGLMAALSSRRAYITYVDQPERTKILKEYMVDFYMSAESIQFCDDSYIEETTAAIKSKYDELTLLDGEGQVSVDKKHYECYEFVGELLDEIQKLAWDNFSYSYEPGSESIEVKAVYGASYLILHGWFRGDYDKLEENYKFDPKDFMIHDVDVPEEAPDGAYIAFGMRKGMMLSEVPSTIPTKKNPYGFNELWVFPEAFIGTGYVALQYTGNKGSEKIVSATAYLDPQVGVPSLEKHYELYEFLRMSFNDVQAYEWDKFEYEIYEEYGMMSIKAVYGTSHIYLSADYYGSFNKNTNYEENLDKFAITSVCVPTTAPDGAYIACGVCKGMTTDDLKGIEGVFLYSNSDGTGMACLYPEGTDVEIRLEFAEEKLSGKINYAKVSPAGMGGG